MLTKGKCNRLRRKRVVECSGLRGGKVFVRLFRQGLQVEVAQSVVGIRLDKEGKSLSA